MSLLPRFPLLVVLTLLAILSSLFSGSAFAAPGPPNPAPCKNAIFAEERLTDNWLVDENKDPPQGLSFTVVRIGFPGTRVNVSEIKPFQVDFSKLQAIFGASNSDYLEGKFQDSNHDTANLLDAKSVDFNKFHGPGQKTAPKVMLDQLRVKYVEYLYNKPELAESANRYADIAGQNPQTVYELVNQFGLPQPPEKGQDRSQWLLTWGRYWEKLPTAYSEFYEGRIIFKAIPSQELITRVKNGKLCPFPLPREITFIMPEFFRTTAVSGQLNQILVPKAAQSEQSNDLILAKATEVKNLLGKIIDKCLQAISPTSLSKSLQKIIKITFNFINPIRTVYAQEGCLTLVPPGKAGEAPYCALPAGQLQPGESCSNQENANKLDKDNPNVICVFRIFWVHPNNPLTIGVTSATEEGAFDECHLVGRGPLLSCSLAVAIWPVFRIPWLAEIWNNTTYSNVESGVISPQEMGRPGAYKFFTPSAIDSTFTFFELDKICRETNDQAACNAVKEIQRICGIFSTSLSTECLEAASRYRLLPGEISQSKDTKERFIGATDCSKEFVRDIALKPKALQEALGIKVGCKISGQ